MSEFIPTTSPDRLCVQVSPAPVETVVCLACMRRG